MKKLIFSLLGLMPCGLTFASHVPGGQITYQCIGPDTYQITLTVFEDCSTAFIGTTPETITITNDCGLPNPAPLSATQTLYQQEISQLCPTALSTCEGGVYPGVYMHTYTGVVTLTGPCDSWHFSYSSCCRNVATNSSTMDSYYWEATVDNSLAPCNNSPTFAAAPIPYVCVGEPVCYSFGVIETDGDSISFAFVPALSTGPGLSITYLPGFTGASPIPGIVIDPISGQITFTPMTAGNYIVCVQITEYDEDGNVIGTVMRDIQFVVVNCVNDIVDCSTAGTIPSSSIVGAVVQTGPTSLQMCEGVPFCFTVSFTDPDPADILTLTSNVGLVLPGSTITTTSGNTATATICWEPPAGSAGAYNSFSIVVADNACPVSGVQTVVYTMDVISGTVASPDVIICGSQEANLSAEGGSTFNWSVISGEPISVGSNFSCNPCANPVATPSVTTTYLVTSDLFGACSNTDTVTVNVVPDFNFTVTQSSSTACLLSDIFINTTITGGTGTGPFTYTWTPDDVTGFGPLDVANPTFTPSTPGAYDFVLTVSNAAGCTYTDTVQVSVAPSYAPDISAISSMDTVLCGDIVDLEVVLGCGVPATCGAALVGSSCGAPNTITVGTFTSQNTTTTYPTPFGHWYANEKHQFLYTAADLNAMGFLGGQITSIGFNVISLGGIPGATYPGYTVKMSCTGLTSLPSGFGVPFPASAFTTVYGPANKTVNVGITTINFTTPFNWDGVSNVLVEVCYNLSPPYTNNCVVQLASTPYTSSVWYNSDGTAACPYPTINSNSNTRPVTRFTYTLSGSDSTDYTYAWTPSTTSPSTMSTSAAPCTSTTYQVVVTDIAGGCTDTATVFVYVDHLCYPPTTVQNNVTCNGGSDGSITATMVGDTGPWDVEWKKNGITFATTSGVTTTDGMTGLSAGTYTIIIYDTTGCSDSAIVNITEPLPFVLTASADDSICINGTFNFSAFAVGGTAPYSFTWSNPSGYSSVTANNTTFPTGDEFYVVNATDNFGCTTDDDTVFVYLYPALSATTSGNTQICMDGSAVITGAAAGGMGAPYTYTWYQNSISSSPIGSGPSIMVSPTVNNTQYCVVVSDGCTTPDANACLVVSFYPEPYPLISLDTAGGCVPVTVNFTNNTNPALVESVNWDFGDGGTAVDPFNVTHTYTVPNNDCYDVSVEITSAAGCVHDTTIVDAVCVLGLPVAGFNYHPQPVDILDTEVTFDNFSSPDVTSYQWYFYDSLSNLIGGSSVAEPIFTFPDQGPGTYPVWLVVTNANGCMDSIQLTVVVIDIFTLYIPNAFTPDGNGTNDIFLPRGSNIDITEYELTIYDKWGSMIFKSTDPLKGWDGTHNSIKSKSDVYVWKIKVKSALSQDRVERIGHVTLLR